MARRAALTCSARTRRARSGDRPARTWASRRFMARATRCCCAPSWMSRSSRRRSASWAAITRVRELSSSRVRARSSWRRSSSWARSATSSQHETGLGREVGEQPLLYGCQRHPGPLLEPEHAQHLVAVPDGRGADTIRPCCCGARRPEPRRCAVIESIGWPASCDRQAVGQPEPDLRPLRAGALGEQSRHVGWEVLGTVAVARVLGEPREDVVRRCHVAGDGSFEHTLHRSEREGDHGGRQHRQDGAG